MRQTAARLPRGWRRSGSCTSALESELVWIAHRWLVHAFIPRPNWSIYKISKHNYCWKHHKQNNIWHEESESLRVTHINHSSGKHARFLAILVLTGPSGWCLRYIISIQPSDCAICTQISRQTGEKCNWTRKAMLAVRRVFFLTEISKYGSKQEVTWHKFVPKMAKDDRRCPLKSLMCFEGSTARHQTFI